ncbi:hypothetical protein C8R47DRAFT_1219368 [Mycena vitilis]|nr:hypothetical protein C8R47DRAFT_1219368 [Mycena vitilis]
MDLPQELVNSIIDAVVDELDLTKDPWLIESTPAVLRTLKSCALVTRAFLHPCQAYIFHGITLSDDPEPADSEPLTPPGLFSTLLKKHPHLASYVRAVYLQSFATVEQDFEPIEHVLASVENLRRLDIDILGDALGHDQQVMWRMYPRSIRASLQSAFALPHLRHVTLWYFNFEDGLELQTLLGGSTNLKTLVLHSPTVLNTQRADGGKTVVAPNMPRVVLDSLQLYFIAEVALQALIDSFTVIDITHLRSVYFHNTPMKSLLRMNAPTIQRVNIRAYYPDSFIDQLIDQDALAGTHDLQAIGLKVPFLSSLNRIIRTCGGFGHLTRLRTISVTVSEKGPLDQWQALDALLGVPDILPALSEVNVYSDNEEPHPELLLQTSMPALAARGVLRIHGFSPDFSLGI